MWEQFLKARKLPSRYYILGHEIDRYEMRLSAPDNINLAKKIIEKLHDKLNPNSTRLSVNHTLAFFMPSYFGEYRIIFHLWGLDEKYIGVEIRSMVKAGQKLGDKRFKIKTQNAVDKILEYLYYIGGQDGNWHLLLEE